MGLARLVADEVYNAPRDVGGFVGVRKPGPPPPKQKIKTLNPKTLNP